MVQTGGFISPSRFLVGACNRFCVSNSFTILSKQKHCILDKKKRMDSIKSMEPGDLNNKTIKTLQMGNENRTSAICKIGHKRANVSLLQHPVLPSVSLEAPNFSQSSTQSSTYSSDIKEEQNTQNNMQNNTHNITQSPPEFDAASCGGDRQERGKEKAFAQEKAPAHLSGCAPAGDDIIDFLKISKACMRNVGNLVPRAPFKRIIASTLDQLAIDDKRYIIDDDETVKRIQYYTEEHLVELFAHSAQQTEHAKRTTLMPRDMRIAAKYKKSTT